MFSSFRYRILSWFLVLTLFSIIIIIPLSIYYFRKKALIENISSSIDKIYILFLQDLNNQNLFFSYETINQDYFTSGESIYILNHDKCFENINGNIDALKTFFSADHDFMTSNFDSLKAHLNNYHEILASIRHNILLRGYKDWGIEGKMRDNAHLLEQYGFIDKSNVLMMRRHEKDYIIRHENQYIEKFRLSGESLLNKFEDNRNLNKETRDSVIQILSEYMSSFNQLVELDRITGIKDQTGQKFQLNFYSETIEKDFEKLFSYSEVYKSKAYQDLKKYYLIVSALLIVLSIVISLYISARVTKPVIQLSGSIEKFVRSGFTTFENSDIKETNDEIMMLNYHFNLLKNEIKSHIHDLNEKVELRTAEITQQKNELEKEREKVLEKNHLIESQKILVENQNKNILSSIFYAKKIQEAILPDEKVIGKILPEYFVLYLPKDIVSGDFYWIDKIISGNRELIMFSVADCTGHGVPGAFMSILGYNAINQAVKEQQKINPAHIISSVNKYVYNTFHDKGKIHITDGMEISFCVLDRKSLTLEFSSTYRPLIIVRNNEIIEIKGEKLEIGSIDSKCFRLPKHKIKLEKDDIIYLFTDGYPDQFGGAEGRKLMIHQFKKLLTSLSGYSMEKQKILLFDKINDWMSFTTNNGKLHEQVDDILILGVKV